MASARDYSLAVALVLAALCGSASCIFCPTNYIPIGTGCFLIVREEKTWDEAIAHCEDNLGELAQSLDQDCQALAALVTYFQSDPLLNHTHFWVGGTNTVVEGQWRWLNGNHISLSPLYWHFLQPSGGQHCLNLAYYDNAHKYNDVSCELKYSSLCRVKPLLSK